MNPTIWKLISDYIHDSYWRKTLKMSEAEIAEHVAKKEAAGFHVADDLNPIQRARLKLLPAEKPSWTNFLRQKETEGSPFSGINMQTGRMAALDDLDEIGIDWQPTPDSYPDSQSWSVLQRAIEEEKGEKRKTKELKKSSRGHSRYGRGGGAIPMDVLESKTAPRGLLGPRKRKY